MALAPVTVFFYQSSANYNLAIVFNGLMFVVATVAAQTVLGRHYKPLIAVDPRHRIAKSSWVVTYVFVAIQMAWVLRPFVGAPSLPPTFFREEAWNNAYVRVWRALLDSF